jgi:hypothetical protein
MTASAATPTVEAINCDVAKLRERAIDSLRLAIEIFNRPEETARVEAVLILFHHSFEMLLKSIVLEETHSVHDRDRGYSYAFDTCLRLTHEDLKVIDRDDRGFLSVLDTLRDSAMHYFQTVSEDLLYVFAQGSVSLFDQLLKKCGGPCLHDIMPNRVMSICGRPPKELNTLLHDEFHALTEQLQQHGLNQSDIAARLRPLLAFTRAGEEPGKRLTPDEVLVAIENLRAAKNWTVVFPTVAQLTFASEGAHMAIGHRIVKDLDAAPARIIKLGEAPPGGGTVYIKEVDLLDKFNMGLHQLAGNLGVSPPKTTAMVREFGIKSNPEMFHEIAIGATRCSRYSKKALDALRPHLPEVEAVWAKHRKSLYAPKRSRR